MAYGPPLNQPNPMLGQQPAPQAGQQQAPQQPTGPGGYTAQGPAGPIQATPTTIGANQPMGLGATRSGNFASTSMMQPGRPMIQGMDATLGAGRTGGTYSYMFANGYADGGMPGQMPAPQPQMQEAPPPQGPGMPMQGGGEQAQGGPFQGGGAPAVDPQMASMRIDQMIQQHPELGSQLQQAAAQMGITPQNAQQVSQIVMLAMQRPELYPQIRQYCIQTFGLDDADMPPQFDPQFMSVLAVLAHVGSAGAGLTAPPPPDQTGMPGQQGMGMSAAPSAAMPGGQPAPGGQPMQAQPPTAMDQPPPQTPSPQPMQSGGNVQGPGTGTSDSIPARLSDGEFVIPADVVRAKGTEFFQKLLDQYHTQVRQ